VALCASMMRAWLGERGELPDDPLIAMVPGSMLDGLRAALEEFHGLLSAEAAASAPAPELVSP
jgi:hypothetical protein